jgi:two-component system cell cycle sensor histidine kinase/response regulator CckA
MAGAEARPIILVVEDDTSVMRFVTSTLAGAGFRVLTAQDGQTGLDLFTQHADEIRMVLADIAMPVMGGIRMSEEILKLRPNTRILLMTGYNDTVVGTTPLKLPLIRKPFLPPDLIRKVKSLLENGTRKSRS